MATKKNQMLTASQVSGKLAQGTYKDIEGLTLRVGPTGKRSWVQQLTVAGKQISLGLGSAPAMGLADAREAAIANKAMARAGGDPREAKKATRPTTRPVQPYGMEESTPTATNPTTSSTTPTLAVLAAEVIEFRAKSWTNDRHANQWAESLRLHVLPLLGNKPVDTITRGDVQNVLIPIWHTKAETARRVRQRMEVIFDFALIRGYIEVNPVVKVEKGLGPQGQAKVPHPAVPHGEVGNVVRAIQSGPSAIEVQLAFEFLILTAARTGEVLGATWAEIDLETRTWTIPADRMKARRAHSVPLSTRAVEVLLLAQELKGNGEWVFPSRRAKGNKGLSKMAFEMALRRLDVQATVHGFRSSFRDWAAESWVSREVAETALAHATNQRDSLGYLRTEFLEQRREVMQSWADYLKDTFKLV